jgi:FkbM family methyltransferase
VYKLAIPEPVAFEAVKVSTDVGELWLPANDLVMLPYMQHAGVWEPGEGRLLRSMLGPAARFLDVGANVGYFSLLAAQASPGGTVDAVEPELRNLALLRLNLWLHSVAAQVWPVGLGNSHGIGSLHVDPKNPGNTTLDSNVVKAIQLAAIARGDELFEGRAFDVVKIDVQGAETDVVTGLSEVLARSPGIRLVVEFFPAAISQRGQAPHDVLQIYESLGFDRVVELDGRLLRLNDNEVLALCAGAGHGGAVNLVLRR